MKQIITHVTHYRYTAPVTYSIQTLRLTPRDDEHQRVLRWHIEAPGALERQVDAYGNITHTLTLNRPHTDIELRVVGQVVVARSRARAGRRGQPAAGACLLRADGADPGRRDHPGLHPPRAADGLNTPDDALALARAICDRVAYEPGMTDVTTAANQVLAMGHGVCQDHAHLFLACARGLGVPARYVSGYLYTTAEHAASHAWADIWLPGAGWTSVDITNRQFASECHCRLAVARDYDSASPVRGVRNGGGEESMEVTVQVQTAAQQ